MPRSTNFHNDATNIHILHYLRLIMHDQQILDLILEGKNVLLGGSVSNLP